MNGLKVYLKSWASQAYVYAQAVFGIFLVANALREYEHVQAHLPKILLTVLAGVMLMLGMLVPKRWRRNLRYVPGILIAVGGYALLTLTHASMVLSYYFMNPFLVYLSYFMMISGILQPLIDPRHYAFFTTEGIKYRSIAFRTIFIPWTEVTGIAYSENGFEVTLKNGIAYRMRPHNGQSQNLRLHIDQMLQTGRQNASTTLNPPRDNPPRSQSRPMANPMDAPQVH